MKHAVLRLALWASAGLLVSVGWGAYFANGNKALPIASIVYALAELTQPAVAVLLHVKPSVALGLTWVAAANAATYALIGLITETIRRPDHSRQGR